MTRVLSDGRVYRGDMGASARKAHRTRRQRLLDQGHTLSKRTFGVEIEYHSEFPVTKRHVAERVGLALGQHVHVTEYHGRRCLTCGLEPRGGQWKIEHDGSLQPRGYGADSTTGEVVSPVLVGQQGLEQLKIVMKAVKEAGGEINSRCGLHVHIGVRDLDHPKMHRLVEQWMDYQRDFFSLVPRGRRTNHFCQPWALGTSMEQKAKLALTDRNYFGTWHKYTALNLLPFGRIGTVEFRLHQGTLNFSKTEAWIHFLLAFVDSVVDLGAFDEQRQNMKPWEFLMNEKYLPAKSAERIAQRAVTYA